MSIKKSYIEIVEFLQANQDKKVKTILEEVLRMAESKKQSSTHLMNKDGTVFAIYCYYHKQWEIVADVPYGSKKNTVTGLNTMCKIGVSKWTKKQRDAKTALANLIDDVANGTIDPSDINQHKEDIETNRLMMDTTDMPVGYASEEEVLAHL
jgi:hypothetical protein